MMNIRLQDYFESCLEMQKEHYAAMLQRNALLRANFDVFIDYVCKHEGHVIGLKLYKYYSNESLRQYNCINSDGTLNTRQFAFTVQGYTKEHGGYTVEYNLHEFIEDYKTLYQWAIIIDLEYKQITFDEFLSDKEDKSKWINELLLFYKEDRTAKAFIVRYAKLNQIDYNKDLIFVKGESCNEAS